MCETADSRVLRLGSAGVWDSGTYSCRVHNGGGTAESRCHLATKL